MNILKRNTDIVKVILGIVAFGVFLPVALVAPNVIGALAKLGIIQLKKYRPLTYINKQVESMIARGLLKKVRRNGVATVELTEKGKLKLKKYKLQSENKTKKKVWDKKWRILIFDVWEKRRATRNLLRFELKDYGFIQLQRSVWIYPYDCEEFIELLKTELKFGKNVRYLLVEKVDNDDLLRRHFKV